MLTVALPMRSNLWGIRLGIKLHVSSEFVWDLTHTTSCLFWGAWVFKINDPEVMLKSHLKNQYTLYRLYMWLHVYIQYILWYSILYIYIYISHIIIYIYVRYTPEIHRNSVYNIYILELMLRIPDRPSIKGRALMAPVTASSPFDKTHGVSPRKMIYE